MNPLLHLYPAAWRERYEDEFLALLEERPLSPFDAFDIVLGALDARLRPKDLAIEFAARRNQPMNDRLSGWAAVVGGVLFSLAFGLGTLLPPPTSEVAMAIFPVAAIALLVALIGLSAVQGRSRPVLAWAAVVVPAAGIVLSLVGLAGMSLRGDAPLLGGIAGWYLLWAGMLGLLLGSILFAAATLMVGIFSRGAAGTLLAGAAFLSLALIVGATGLADLPEALVVATHLAGLLLFGGGWVWLGYAAATQPAMAPEGGHA